jgi:hypothetical protein
LVGIDATFNPLAASMFTIDSEVELTSNSEEIKYEPSVKRNEIEVIEFISSANQTLLIVTDGIAEKEIPEALNPMVCSKRIFSELFDDVVAMEVKVNPSGI